MRKILMSFALCAVAFSASAGFALQPLAPAAQHEKPAGLIKTASARTAAAEGAPSQVVATQRKADPAPEPEHRRRTGPAMLVAALAVMTAIALRRLSATHL